MQKECFKQVIAMYSFSLEKKREVRQDQKNLHRSGLCARFSFSGFQMTCQSSPRTKKLFWDPNFVLHIKSIDVVET